MGAVAITAGCWRASGDSNMILVFGRSGQVGHELAKLDGVLALNRAEADLSDPEACAKQILNHRPTAVINAAAYTAVDNADFSNSSSTTITSQPFPPLFSTDVTACFSN